MTLTQRLARFVAHLIGWKILDLAELPRKAVVIGYPHTSNWDLACVVLGMAALGFTPRWAGKDTMFKGWRGPLMRKLGGIPVNRRERTSFVGRMAQEFSASDKFLMVIAPEGTRGLAQGWKSGFYHIALAAKVPVLAGVADYARKEVGIAAVLMMSGDEAADMAAIAQAYQGRQGHTSARASPIKLLK